MVGVRDAGGGAEGSWQEIAPGVLRRRVEPLDLNVAAVRGPAGLVLVDTGSYAREARELLRGLLAVVPGPVTAVVNTHGHFDHCFGNDAVLREFPGVPLWGHEALPAYLDEHGEASRAEAVAYGMPEADVAGVRIVAPGRLVAAGGTAVLDLGGGRAVELIAPGRGHTGADLVVHVPDAGVLIAGDLVEESADPSYGPDSYPGEWPGTLARLMALPHVSLVLPGHGEPRGREWLAGQYAHVTHVAQGGLRDF